MIIIRRLVGVMGVGLGLFSLVCVAAGWDGKDGLAMKIGLTLLFLGFGVGCALLARWGFAQPLDGPATPDARSAQLREILKLAQQHHGELSLMAAAAGTTLSLEACRTYLEELVTEGMAQMSVEDDGVILYRFPDFMHALPEPEHRAELNLFSLQKKLRSVSSCPQPAFFNT